MCVRWWWDVILLNVFQLLSKKKTLNDIVAYFKYFFVLKM